MRVGIDYRPAIFSRSGIARSVRELARALHARGDVELELFAHGYQRAQRELLSAARTVHGARLHRSRLPGRSLPALARIGVDAARLSRGREALELFHWTDYVYPPLRRGTRVTMTVHDVAFAESDAWHGAAQSRELRARFERALARCAAIATPSQATREQLRAHFDVRVPIEVIPFGVDHVARADASAGRAHAARALGTDAPYLVMLGTLEPRKRHAEVLDALTSLAEKGRRVPLLVLGAAGWGDQALRARLAQPQPFPHAWLADTRDDELYALVAGARGLLYPSSLEGFGFPPLEALALGVPPVVGDCPALRETCGDAALFVDGSDARSIASAVEALLDDGAQRRAILDAWRARRARFSWDACAAGYARFFHEHGAAPA